MSKELILMIGVPASGKSTFAAAWCKHTNANGRKCEVISRDAIRFSLLQEGEEYFAHEDDVWKNYVNEAVRSLNENDVTILDATHINRASRNKILSAVRAKYRGEPFKLIGVIMDEHIKVCIERNAKRPKKTFVPENQLMQINFNKEYPTKAERFDIVYRACFLNDINSYDMETYHYD